MCTSRPTVLELRANTVPNEICPDKADANGNTHNKAIALAIVFDTRLIRFKAISLILCKHL